MFNQPNQQTSTVLGQMPQVGTPDLNAGVPDMSTASQIYSQMAKDNQPQPQPQDTGNWFTKALPTIGSIAAPVVGGLLAPATGGLSLLAGAALSGLGSAGGKVLENAIEGKTQDVGGILESGLEGAGGGIVGGVGNKVIGGIGKKVFGGVADAAQRSTASKAAAQTEQNLAQEFGGVSKAAKQNMNFGNSLDLADEAGIPKTAQGFAEARNVATGANGYLNSVLDTIVRNHGPVNLENYGKIVQDAIKTHPELGNLEAVSGSRGGLPKPADTTASGMKNLFSDLLQQTGFGGQGSLSMSAEPDKALDLLRQVRTLGQRYAGSEPGTPGAAQYDVYNKVYQGLKNSIYGRPEINAAIKTHVPTAEDLAAVTKMAGGNQKLAQYLVDTAKNAQTAKDLLAPQARFMSMGDLGEEALKYNKNVVGTGQTAKAAAQAAQAEAAPLETLTGAATHGLLNKIGVPTSLLGATTGNPMLMAAGAVPDILGSAPIKEKGAELVNKLTQSGVTPKIAKGMSLALPAMAQLTAHGNDFTPTPTTGTQNNMTVQGGADTMVPTQPSPLERAYDIALVGSTSPYSAGSYTPLLQQLTGGMQSASMAPTALAGAQNAFEQAGGGQGVVSGLLSKFGGALTGGPVRGYEEQKQQLAAQLMKMGVPATAIPDVTDTSANAEAKWASLSNLIGSMGGSNSLLGSIVGS